MVFFGKNYWTQTLPAESLLEALFKNNNRGQEYKDNVLVTSDENQTIDFIVSTRYTPEDAPALIFRTALQYPARIKKTKPWESAALFMLQSWSATAPRVLRLPFRTPLAQASENKRA